MNDTKEKKAPKAKAEKAPRKLAGYDYSATIRVVAEENPKRKDSASYKRFSKYRDGMTIAEAIKAGVKATDIPWDLKKNYIKIAA